MTTAKNTRLGFLGALIAATTLLLASAASAQAAPGAAWRIDSEANTTALPGDTLTYHLQVGNVGTEDADGSPIVTTVSLPAGLSGVSASGQEPGISELNCSGDGTELITDPSGVLGAHTIECATENPVPVHGGSASQLRYTIAVKVDAGVTVPTVLTDSIKVEGGGGATVTSADPTRIEAVRPFGVDAFDAEVAADAAGSLFTIAAAHPYSSTAAMDFNTLTSPVPTQGDLWPVEPTKDIAVDLPPGAVGSTRGLPQCTAVQLANGAGVLESPLCPEESQIGTILLRLNGSDILTNSAGPISIFNMVPPPGVPARFGFNFQNNIVLLDAHLRSSGDYGLSIVSRDVSEGIPLAGTTTTFWGVPADESHTPERTCLGSNSPAFGGATCPSPKVTEPSAFLRNPTSCTGPMSTALHIDSWTHPATFDENGEPKTSESAWQSAESVSHEAPGYPYFEEEEGTRKWGERAGLGECEEVLFEPEVSIAPTNEAADSPTGLAFDLSIPQTCWEANHENETCQSDLRKAEVTLPQGMSVNPSSADGLGGCSAAQIGLITPEGSTPIHFDEADPACPESSRIGTVDIETPLIEEHLSGSVYLASQGDNPFKSLLALYIVAKSNGVIVKFPAHVEASSGTGQLTTVVEELPQLPFSHMHLELNKAGQRASLINPPSCGSFASTAVLTPWSGNGAVTRGSSFQVSKGPGGGACPSHPAAFNPKLSAGTQNPLAGAFSPFTLKLSREDGTQRLAGLEATMPPGLIGKLAGIPYCSEAALASIPKAEGTAAAQLANPSCPAASRIGTNTAATGAGISPFQIDAPVYLAGPYKGAPLSLAIVTPALAGPFDLGNVLVRAALRVDPETTQITAVTDPLPTILFGLPLDIRSTETRIDRPNFILNPTSCDEMSVGGTVSGTEGASAHVSDRFQALGCDKLGFKPKLSFRLKGKTRRGGNPQFSATLTMPPGGANIARAQVSLPHSEFLDQSHIKTICTRVQFAASQCPAKSVYGFARAITPLLDKPLEGPVYLRSSSHNLPDLVADLNGQIHVVLDGRIDSHNKGIRNTFELVPDAPVSKFTLTMQGGAKGLLQNSRNLCKSPSKVSVEFDAQNGKISDSTPPLVAASCGAKAHKHKRRHR